MIFLTSDTHFGHKNIIKYINRPFDTVEEMDETIINNINNVDGKHDELYILGDFTLWGNYNKVKSYRDRINCKFLYLILGNHDRRLNVKYVKYVKYTNKESIFLQERNYYELNYNDCRFCLSHYPFMSWHGRDHNSIMCHGHIHSDKRGNEINKWQGIRRYDVGVDANDYTPRKHSQKLLPDLPERILFRLYFRILQ